MGGNVQSCTVFCSSCKLSPAFPENGAASVALAHATSTTLPMETGILPNSIAKLNPENA